MGITAIILAHFKEREANLGRIINDLLDGTVEPEKIIVFIDNPEIVFEDTRVTIIRSSTPFRPNIRFALGSIAESDYCFFIDDDLSVKPRTLENFAKYIGLAGPDTILGVEGSILGKTDTPYSDDKPIRRYAYAEPIEVDIIIKTYFVPTRSLTAGLLLRKLHPELPLESLDDVFLCLGNKYLNKGCNFVVPIDSESDFVDLDEMGVGQSRQGSHYGNRNEACKILRYLYEK